MGLKNKIISCVIFCGLFSTPLPAQTVRLKERPLPKGHDECQSCHLKKIKKFIPAARRLQREHWEKSLNHGNLAISCNHCHDISNRNYLRFSKKFPATFRDSSPVCQRCHLEEYRDWSEGIHGKRDGGWNLDKTQYHCIDCHDAHDVRFKTMRAVPPPKKRGR